MAFIAGVLTRAPWGLPIGFVIGFALPFVVLNIKRGRRMRTFEEQFPEALDLIARALKAGHAFATGMKMVADELPEPVGPEFRKTFEEQNFGLPLKDALDNLTRRIPLLDVRFFATAVLIQRETGGNLAEILENLAPRRSRAVQDSPSSPRLHGARPVHRLRTARAAGSARHRAVVHQPGSHEHAVPRTHGADDAARSPS